MKKKPLTIIINLKDWLEREDLAFGTDSSVVAVLSLQRSKPS